MSSPLQPLYTPLDSIPEIVNKLRKTFRSGRTKSEEYRLAQLKNLLRLVEENKQKIYESTAKDLGKPSFEGFVGEILGIQNDLSAAIDELRCWMRPKLADKVAALITDQTEVVYEPLGVVLIIGAWNYPVQLTLQPLIGAIASGNCAIIKPSEVSEHTATLISNLIPQYLDNEAYQVINGSVEETTALLKQKFDHILYTGNSTVGRIVMKAASEHLTPVTLEMGGKSPTIVDSDVDVAVTARRILWGKLMNAGQTCIAPDYVLVHKAVHAELIKEFTLAVKEFYGADVSSSPDYSRIVNERQFLRLKNLLDETVSKDKTAVVAVGGQTDQKSKFISPTVVDNVSPDSPLMKSEIFGPILPVVEISSIDEAIDFILQRDKPLALYLFSRNSSVIERVKVETTSGAMVVNDTLLHAGVQDLPFGGVGESGIGAYHGKRSFEIFSHKKAYLRRSFFLHQIDKLRLPPYNDKHLNYLGMLFGRTYSSNVVTYSLRVLLQYFVLFTSLLLSLYLHMTK